MLNASAVSISCSRDGIIDAGEMCDGPAEEAGCDANCNQKVGYQCVGGVGETSICDRGAFSP